MAVLAVAITLSFHLTHRPSDLERRMAKPLGVVFWLLAAATLVIGLGNYISITPSLVSFLSPFPSSPSRSPRLTSARCQQP